MQTNVCILLKGVLYLIQIRRGLAEKTRLDREEINRTTIKSEVSNAEGT